MNDAELQALVEKAVKKALEERSKGPYKTEVTKHVRTDEYNTLQDMGVTGLTVTVSMD